MSPIWIFKLQTSRALSYLLFPDGTRASCENIEILVNSSLYCLAPIFTRGLYLRELRHLWRLTPTVEYLSFFIYTSYIFYIVLNIMALNLLLFIKFEKATCVYIEHNYNTKIFNVQGAPALHL